MASLLACLVVGARSRGADKASSNGDRKEVDSDCDLRFCDFEKKVSNGNRKDVDSDCDFAISKSSTRDYQNGLDRTEVQDSHTVFFLVQQQERDRFRLRCDAIVPISRYDCDFAIFESLNKRLSKWAW